MEDLAISESGELAVSVEVELIAFTGATVTTRGVKVKLAESPGQLEGSFNDSGWCCWALVPPNFREVEFINAHGKKWRVFTAEERLSALWRPGDRRATRFMLSEAK